MNYNFYFNKGIFPLFCCTNAQNRLSGFDKNINFIEFFNSFKNDNKDNLQLKNFLGNSYGNTTIQTFVVIRNLFNTLFNNFYKYRNTKNSLTPDYTQIPQNQNSLFCNLLVPNFYYNIRGEAQFINSDDKTQYDSIKLTNISS